MIRVGRLIAACIVSAAQAGAQMQMSQPSQTVNFVFDWPENYAYTNAHLQGCRKDTGSMQIKCDISFRINKDSDDTPLIALGDFTVVFSDGSASQVQGFTLNGKSYNSDTRLTLYPGIDYNLTLIWKPDNINFSSIKYLDVGYKGHNARWARFENVSLNPPTPVVQRPAPAPAPVVNSGQYTIQLSGCTASGNGGYTCTGAVVTPKR